MKLALGTAQFGLAYGVVGRDEHIGDAAARQILRRAAELGIDLLDTAPAYGDIEQRLAALGSGSIDEPTTGDVHTSTAASEAPPLRPHASRFAVVTKIAPLARTHEADADGQTAVGLVRASLQRSRGRLGSALQSVLFHGADDLLGRHGEALWDAASKLCADWGVRLGVSCYGPAELQALAERFPVAVAQLPGNAFDQRLTGRHFPGIELHMRSGFLQGLLLAPAEVGGSRVPAAAAALRRWHAGCKERGLSPLAAALGAVKALPEVQRCVVGVDSLSQLEEIAAAWERAVPLAWPELATEDPAVIDPRAWSLA